VIECEFWWDSHTQAAALGARIPVVLVPRKSFERRLKHIFSSYVIIAQVNQSSSDARSHTKSDGNLDYDPTKGF
jgi:hypothetical protein